MKSFNEHPNLNELSKRPELGAYPASGLALFKMRMRTFSNVFAALKGVLLIRPLVLLFCSFIIWGLVFGTSLAGFNFLKDQKLPLGGGIIGLLFDLLFFSLGSLLVLSSGMILYGGLFSSPETNFLLTKPIKADRIFAYRFVEAIGFSSWAFVILGSPILIAFGVVADSPMLFYIYLPFFFFGYVLIPGSIGAVLCLLIAGLLPKGKKLFFSILVVAFVFLVLSGMGRFFSSVKRDGIDREFVDATLRQFEFSRWSGLPSYWISRGLRAAGRGDVSKANFNLLLIWSNGMMLYLGGALLSKVLYRRAFDRMIAFGSSSKKSSRAFFLDRLFEKSLGFLGSARRALILKDFRAFRREPRQWVQVLVFGFLLFLYFGSVRRSFRGEVTWPYQNGVSMLNLFAVSLLQCTYVGRFVFPMISLEGKNFWILGLVPMPRESILWAKFHFAFWSTTPIAILLVIFSDFMLKMPFDYHLVHIWTTLVASLGICALGVGLGACLPNFKETDPSKIAAGFGGTLNLVISLFLLILLMGLLSGIWHLNHTGENYVNPSFTGILFIIAGVASGSLIGLMAALIPMALGSQNLRSKEF